MSLALQKCLFKSQSDIHLGGNHAGRIAVIRLTFWCKESLLTFANTKGRTRKGASCGERRKSDEVKSVECRTLQVGKTTGDAGRIPQERTPLLESLGCSPVAFVPTTSLFLAWQQASKETRHLQYSILVVSGLLFRLVTGF
jgi:hypothetical protein